MWQKVVPLLSSRKASLKIKQNKVSMVEFSNAKMPDERHFPRQKYPVRAETSKRT